MTEYEKIHEVTDTAKLTFYWGVGIILNRTCGYYPSQYMVDLSQKHVDGKVTMEEIDEMIKDAFQNKDLHDKVIADNYEGDLLSKRIVELMSDSGFTFSPVTLKAYHKYLFEDIMKKEDVGRFRSNSENREETSIGINKNEDESKTIDEKIKIMLEEEKKYRYTYPMNNEDIKHVLLFAGGLVQLSPFIRGNIRTVSVFVIKYLFSIGFDVDATIAQLSDYLDLN